MALSEPTLVDYIKIILKNFKKIFIYTLIISIVAAIISLFLPKWYRASAVVLSPNTSTSGFGMLGFVGDLGMGGMFGGDETLYRCLTILKSRQLLESVALKYNFQDKYKADNLEETIKKLRKKLDFEIGDENQLTISFLDKDQENVANITNYIVNCLDSINIVLETTQARNNREFIEKRVTEVVDSLNVIANNLANFMEDNRLISLTDQVAVGIEKAAVLQAEAISTEIELEVAQKIFHKDDPKIKELEYKLKSIRSKYNEYLTKNPLIPNFSKVPDLEMNIVKMQRSIDYYTKLIEYLGPQYEQSKIDEKKDIPTLQVLDRAVRPERKAKPKRALIVIITGFISGLFLSSFYIIKDQKNIIDDLC